MVLPEKLQFFKPAFSGDNPIIKLGRRESKFVRNYKNPEDGSHFTFTEIAGSGMTPDTPGVRAALAEGGFSQESPFSRTHRKHV